MSAEVCTTHNHKRLLVVENPRFARMLSCIKHLPEDDEHDESVAEEDDFEDSMDEVRLALWPVLV